ncbi:unnamed protein product [Oikopleura dioica]|uniref:Protein kinase domain-containing protein n=1 Tax=Oikopleura dioica TaxID=34765 RepID=E4YZP1_OIKDI|nr:unnamed protein product [Oikopleura dioica]
MDTTAQDESKLLINLNHKNVVRLFEYFTSGVPKRLYMIMEYIRGRELFDIMCDEQVFVNITEIAIRPVFINIYFFPKNG